jgi:hypothetical protein
MRACGLHTRSTEPKYLCRLDRHRQRKKFSRDPDRVVKVADAHTVDIRAHAEDDGFRM